MLNKILDDLKSYFSITYNFKADSAVSLFLVVVVVVRGIFSDMLPNIGSFQDYAFFWFNGQEKSEMK